ELYALATDPGETEDVASDAALAPIRDRLAAALLAWQQASGDPWAEESCARRSCGKLARRSCARPGHRGPERGDAQTTRVPASMGAEGASRMEVDSSSVSAHRSMHSERSPRIRVGLRLISPITVRPCSSSSV